MEINTRSKTLKSSKKDSNNCTKNSKNKIDNSQATKNRKTNNVLPNSANLSLPIEESENNLTLIIKVAVAKGNDIIEPESSHLDTDDDDTSDDRCWTLEILVYKPLIRLPKKIKVKIILYSKTKTRKLKLNSNRRSDGNIIWKNFQMAASLGSLNAQVMMNLRLFRYDLLFGFQEYLWIRVENLMV
ncbi:unnamed protein product [Rhizophagus irregularis]|nr:unnamed protein product [Rhizophagus irregularis]